MNNPADIAQAQHIAQRRAERRHRPAAEPLPDPAVYGERCADHGDDSGREFRTETAQRLAATHDAVSRIHRNPILTGAEKLLSVAADVEKRAKVIAVDFDTQRYLIANKQAELTEAIDRALQAPRSDWEPKAAELRAVLRGMDDRQRFAFLDAVKGTREERLVEFAIASVPAVMSGLSFGIHKQMRDAVLERHDPTLLTRPKDLAQRAKLLEVAEQGFKQSIAELVDFDKANALRSLVDDTP